MYYKHFLFSFYTPASRSPHVWDVQGQENQLHHLYRVHSPPFTDSGASFVGWVGDWNSLYCLLFLTPFLLGKPLWPLFVKPLKHYVGEDSTTEPHCQPGKTILENLTYLLVFGGWPRHTVECELFSLLLYCAIFWISKCLRYYSGQLHYWLWYECKHFSPWRLKKKKSRALMSWGNSKSCEIGKEEITSHFKKEHKKRKQAGELKVWP